VGYTGSDKTIYGDFFLHDEPGAPFFPSDEKDAKLLYIKEIPFFYL